MTDFLTLDDLPLHGKTVLVRADLNVPMQEGKITDASRIERIIPTLKELETQQCKIVILSHFGRPDGKVDAKFSLKPVALELERLLKKPVQFAADCVGPIAHKAVETLKQGDVLLLENTRFHAAEEKNDPAFCKELASLGDVFVNDAFSAAHRAHASTEGIAHCMTSIAGRLMQAELNALSKALSNPVRPLAAIVGGAKISTKLDLLHNLIGKVDMLILGGGMANTFLAAQGLAIGKSLVETSMIATAKDISAEATKRNCHIVLPKDAVVAQALEKGVATKTVPVTAVPSDMMILDVGPASIASMKNDLALCKTVVWNGPLGAFETSPFDRGTTELAIYVADLTKRGILLSVAGGGDTVSAMAHAGVINGLSYLSGAGGAFLEWLEGKELPGVAVLKLSVPQMKIGKVII